MAAPLIIDVHMHIYRDRAWGQKRKDAYHIWEYGEKPDVQFSPSGGSLEEALQAIDDAGYSRVVIASMFTADQERLYAIEHLPVGLEGDRLAEATLEIESSLDRLLREFNSWACEVARPHAKLIPFIAADPAALPGEEGSAHVREMVEDHGARGIKLHPVAQEFEMADRRMWPTYQACQDLGIPIVAHSGPAHSGHPYGEPGAFAEVLESFPSLDIILAHLGGGAWHQALELTRAYPNAYFDCCEIIEWTGAPNAPTDQQLARLIKDIGPERVMMGTDFPWYDLDHSVERVTGLPVLSTEEKEAMLGINAARLLGL
jgi:predicted TIM-barrel fold metal-dependent hydrolase